MSVVGIDGEVRCGRSSESVSVRVVEGYRRQREWKGPESAMRVGDGGWRGRARLSMETRSKSACCPGSSVFNRGTQTVSVAEVAFEMLMRFKRMTCREKKEERSNQTIAIFQVYLSQTVYPSLLNY
jgi:hypothetical protein